jgi:hypothetical protein
MITIYTLSDPRCPDKIRYVGLTKSPRYLRLSEHILEAFRAPKLTGVNKEKAAWIRSLVCAGIMPCIVGIDVVSAPGGPAEQAAIKAYRAAGHDLFNKQAGRPLGTKRPYSYC